MKDFPDQAQRIAGCSYHAFVDMGYRGHGQTGAVNVHVNKRRRAADRKKLVAMDETACCDRTRDRTP